MSESFLVLTCKSCGAKLNVYEDMDRFACTYCGTEMIVQRREGTVSLKLLHDALKGVQAGTDKTAAELALVRYQKQLAELRSKESALLATFSAAKESAENSGCWAGLAALVFGAGGLFMTIAALVGVFRIHTEDEFKNWFGPFGVGVAFLVIALICYRYKPDLKPRQAAEAELREVQSEIQQLNQQIAEKNSIADS